MSDLSKAIAAGLARHAVTAIAGLLAAHGIIQTDQKTAAVQVGSSIVLWGLGALWSVVQKKKTLGTDQLPLRF